MICLYNLFDVCATIKITTPKSLAEKAFNRCGELHTHMFVWYEVNFVRNILLSDLNNYK